MYLMPIVKLHFYVCSCYIGCARKANGFLKFKNLLAILTFIVYSAVWSLVEMERWLVQHRVARVAGKLGFKFQKPSGVSGALCACK
jgi:hypothetical protein